MLNLSNLDAKRIVIVKPSALGDIAHAVSILPVLRQRFPSARLAWIVNKSYVPMLQGHPDLDEIIPFDRGRFGRGWLADGSMFLSFLRRIRRRHFDLAIDLQGLLRSGLITRGTGARTRIGLASAREGARFCYTHRVDDGTGIHAVERYHRVMEDLGITSKARPFHVPIDAESQAWVDRLLQSCPRPWLAVGVGARWLTKRWPPQHFAELVNRAQKTFGGTAIFIGAPDEAALAQTSAALVSGPTCQLAGKTSLKQLIALLGVVDVMIANDTGPLHVAVALGRPIVAPYTCTLVRTTGPYGQTHRAVETNVWCRGSMVKQCNRLDCMDELTPDRLWPLLREIMQTWQRQAHAA